MDEFFKWKEEEGREIFTKRVRSNGCSTKNGHHFNKSHFKSIRGNKGTGSCRISYNHSPAMIIAKESKDGVRLKYYPCHNHKLGTANTNHFYPIENKSNADGTTAGQSFPQLSGHYNVADETFNENVLNSSKNQFGTASCTDKTEEMSLDHNSLGSNLRKSDELSQNSDWEKCQVDACDSQLAFNCVHDVENGLATKTDGSSSTYVHKSQSQIDSFKVELRSLSSVPTEVFMMDHDYGRVDPDSNLNQLKNNITSQNLIDVEIGENTSQCQKDSSLLYGAMLDHNYGQDEVIIKLREINKTRQQLEMKLIKLLRIIALDELKPFLADFHLVVAALCKQAEDHLCSSDAIVDQKFDQVNGSLSNSRKESNKKMECGLASPEDVANSKKDLLQGTQLTLNKCEESILSGIDHNIEKNLYNDAIPESDNFSEPCAEYLATSLETAELEKNVPPEVSFTSLLCIHKHKDIIINVGSQQLNVVHLKSIDIFISDEEVERLTKICPIFRKGELFDCVITAFLEVLALKFDNVTVVDIAVTSLMSHNVDYTQEFSELKFGPESILLLPLNIDGNHWALMVVNLNLREIIFCDPISVADIHRYGQIIKPWIELLNRSSGNDNDWTLFQPQRMMQNDPHNCGVYVCWYGQQYLHQKSYIEPFNPDSYRKHIYGTIIDNSRNIELHKTVIEK